MAKFNYMQLMTNPTYVKVGDEICFDDILDYMGKIAAVGCAGAKLAERNLILDVNFKPGTTTFKVAESGANPRPSTSPPNN